MSVSKLYRIGQIVPSSNTTMETEIPAMFHARESVRDGRFTFHSSRMRMHKVTQSELQAMNREATRCAAELSDARVDLMSTACLVATMASGLGDHRRLENELEAVARENHCGAAVMSSAGALIEGLHILGAKRISIIAPYTKYLTKLVTAYIENEGIEVVDALCFEIEDNVEVGRRDPALLVDDVYRVKTSNVDVVVLSVCVQMQSLPAVPLVEERLGIPVTSTAICTVRRMLDRLQLEPFVPKAGALLTKKTPGIPATRAEDVSWGRESD